MVDGDAQRMIQSPAITLSGQHDIAGARLFGPLTVEMPAAQWTCLLGPSGVGKSTILRLILGLDTGGTFQGQITASDGRPVAERVGYMAQDDLLLPWASVLENVVIGARLRGNAVDIARAEGLLERVGLSAHSAKTPRALSGGMRQRAALARTLMEDRPVVLLDEPFSALDARTRAEMQELAVEVLAGKTVLLVTHDPAEAARLGHKILVLSAEQALDWPVPPSRTIRDIHAPETLACQAALFTHLREAA